MAGASSPKQIAEKVARAVVQRTLILFYIFWISRRHRERMYMSAIYLCHLSSVVEQHFCKVKVLGSNPRGGSNFYLAGNPLFLKIDLYRSFLYQT
jgi:hypothetical protein